MARTLNPDAHAVRRDVFVDAAQRLIQVKGYEGLSIHEILEAVDASKGAFYHYFDSKAALLEAVVERMSHDALATLTPLVDDPNLSAVQKFEGVFTGIARWKGERTELLMAVTRVWLSDDNAIVREKFRRGTVRNLVPLLARIVAQGQHEGTFMAGSPEHVARVLVSLMLGANEAAVELYFARQAGAVSFEVVEDTLAAYWAAFERLLGTPAGSLTGVDPSILRQWYG